MLVLIVSLLCEHCDFDHLGDQREGMFERPPIKQLASSDPPRPRREKRPASSFSSKQTLRSVHRAGP